MKRLKRVVLKEELVALTEDYTDAIILNQFIYWSERVKDFDKFIDEEKKRANAEGKEITMPNCNGWIYKTSEEMSSDTLTFLAATNMRNRIKKLVEKKWIEERNNPEYKWDKTKQYRVNLKQICIDLNKIGYVLEGYKYDVSKLLREGNHESEYGTQQNEVSSDESRNHKYESRNYKSQIAVAIPEITTEITTEITELVSPSESISQDNYPDDDVVVKKIVKNAEVHLYESRLFIEQIIKNLYTDGSMPYQLKMGLTWLEIRDRLKLLQQRHIDRALTKFRLAGPVKNKELYFSKCLLTAIVEADLDFENEDMEETNND